MATIKLTFDIEICEEGVEEFWAQYPDLADTDKRNVAKLFAREAVANWEIQELLLDVTCSEGVCREIEL